MESTTKEITQEQARAMLAALKAARDYIPVCSTEGRMIARAIEAAEGQ